MHSGCAQGQINLKRNQICVTDVPVTHQKLSLRVTCTSQQQCCLYCHLLWDGHSIHSFIHSSAAQQPEVGHGSLNGLPPKLPVLGSSPPISYSSLCQIIG